MRVQHCWPLAEKNSEPISARMKPTVYYFCTVTCRNKHDCICAEIGSLRLEHTVV